MTSPADITYSGYLQLDKILQAQAPLSSAHDEMLFIIQHQTSELWMKLAIHELNATCRLIEEDDMRRAFKTLSRVSRILEQLNSAWDVLRTMTPSEYTQFRGSLGQSSGFQSSQYRMIEFLVGNKNAAMIQSYRDDAGIVAAAGRRRFTRPASTISRSGFCIAAALPSTRPCSNAMSPCRISPNDSVVAAWLAVYREPARFWELYELAEKLVDFEDYFRRWRFNHVTTVERIIGFKRGTGGSAGVSYLRKMLDVVLFPELWQVRTAL